MTEKPVRRPATDREIEIKRLARTIYNTRKPPKVTLPAVGDRRHDER